jgi:hypothetical protein
LLIDDFLNTPRIIQDVVIDAVQNIHNYPGLKPLPGAGEKLRAMSRGGERPAETKNS